MTSTDVLLLLRQVLSDLNSSGRWTDSTLLNFIDRANKRVVRDVLFPESRLSAPTALAAGSQFYFQEYQIPQLILINRVYLAGQLCVPTDINTLEGHQIGLYQQNPTASAPTVGSGGAPGTSGPYAPEWSTTTAQTYPVANSGGYPAPDAQPFFAGQRPRYYLRGGYIGFVPPPANTATITIDCIRVPSTITAVGQALTSPDMFMDAIAWGAATYAQFADDQERNAAMRKVAEETYQARKSDLMKFRKTYVGDANEGPKPRTYRSSWKRYRMQRN